jgi:hypothetical protein
MNWLLRLVVIWFSLDVVIMATGWYAKSIVKVQFPNWWRRVICDLLHPAIDGKPIRIEAMIEESE